MLRLAVGVRANWLGTLPGALELSNAVGLQKIGAEATRTR